MQAPTEAQRKRGLTARKVVEAFGNCDELAKMYCKHVTWRLNHSLAPNVKGPHVGKEKVMPFNFAVFNKFYKTGTTEVEILDSVCRFNMKATKPNGKPYYVEYVLFCKTCVNSGLVTEIVELFDTQ